MSLGRAILIVLATLVSVAIAGQAQAQCNIDLRGVGNVRFSGAEQYSVFGTSDVVLAVQFSVRHRPSDACSYFVTFSTAAAGAYDRRMYDGLEELAYQLYDSAGQTNVLKALPDATAGEVLSGTFATAGRETQDLTYYAVIPARQVVPPGTFEDNVTLTLYEGTVASYFERDSAAVRLRAGINGEVEVCIGCFAAFDPAAQSHQMDFGELTEGETATTHTRARGNAGYVLTLASGNRGVMQHLTESTEVPYVLAVNGAAADLSGPRVDVAQTTTPTGIDGDLFEFLVTIGTTALAAAGDYEDHITVTVTAK